MQLIVGLGNPGPDYERTRHNVGQWFVEALAYQFDLTFKLESKFCGKIASHGGMRLFIPTTYMNESGLAIRAVSQFYKIPADEILVAHDELDFPPGKVKIKKDGGHGGHNGLRDTIKHLSSPAFARVRIGIGHPGDRNRVTDYVLSRPSVSDQQKIEDAIDEVLRVMPQVMQGELQAAMKKLHSEEENGL